MVFVGKVIRASFVGKVVRASFVGKGLQFNLLFSVFYIVFLIIYSSLKFKNEETVFKIVQIHIIVKYYLKTYGNLSERGIMFAMASVEGGHEGQGRQLTTRGIQRTPESAFEENKRKYIDFSPYQNG